MRFGVVEIRVRVPPRIAAYPRGIINREGEIFARRESTKTAGPAKSKDKTPAKVKKAETAPSKEEKTEKEETQ